MPPEDQDEDNLLSAIGVPGNHSLGADSLEYKIEGRIKSELQGAVDVTALKVRIRGTGV